VLTWQNASTHQHQQARHKHSRAQLATRSATQNDLQRAVRPPRPMPPGDAGCPVTVGSHRIGYRSTAPRPDRRLFTVRVTGRGLLLSKRYFRFWRGHCRRDTMICTADRWPTRDAPSLRNHDRCRLEYVQMWPSASARAAARSAPSSSAIAFPVDAATRTNSRYPCVCDATLRRRPGRRACSTSRYRRSSSAVSSNSPVADLGVQRRLDPSIGLRFLTVDAVHRERKRRGPHLVARLAGHAAHQGVEDRLVVVGVHAPGHLGREPREHLVGAGEPRPGRPVGLAGLAGGAVSARRSGHRRCAGSPP
jgi:hypothetical protein